MSTVTPIHQRQIVRHPSPAGSTTKNIFISIYWPEEQPHFSFVASDSVQTRHTFSLTTDLESLICSGHPVADLHLIADTGAFHPILGKGWATTIRTAEFGDTCRSADRSNVNIIRQRLGNITFCRSQWTLAR
jgi:hypothetical protein